MTYLDIFVFVFFSVLFINTCYEDEEYQDYLDS